MAIRAQARAVERPVGIEVIEGRADHAKSMEILAANKLRPLTYQKAFSLFSREESHELIKTLRGMWFYLDGQGTGKSGMHTFDEKGELVELTINESIFQNISQNVRVYPGSLPLSLIVNVDSRLGRQGRQFYLYANGPPEYAAPVVVGLKTDTKTAAKDAVRE